MPRRKQPRSLENLSLRTLANNAVKACKRSRGRLEKEIISQYVCSIPNILANDYVVEVLRVCSGLDEDCNIASALHCKCTEIIRRDYIAISTKWYHKLISSLHVMSDLQVLQDVSDGCKQKGRRRRRPHSFPGLAKLRIIESPLMTSQPLLTPIVQSSPQLEEIVMSGISTPPQDLCPLANLKRLRKIICVTAIQPRDVVHLLENLPKLEVLTISDVKGVLSLCQHPYPCLKDFAAWTYVEGIMLEKVAIYFPNLENLFLQLGEQEADLSPVNILTNLKSLMIQSATASLLLCLLDNCMSHLTSLALFNLHGLDPVFGPNRNLSFPLLECLIIYSCYGVNLAAIGEIFPNLKSLQANYNEFTGLHLYPTAHAFQAIEDFIVDATMPRRYIRHILSRENLKNLQIMCNDHESLIVCTELFQDMRQEALQTLTIHDNCMTKEVIPVILGSSGDDLQYVCLGSERVILSSSECEELSYQLQPYDMIFDIHFCKYPQRQTYFKYDSHK